MLASDPPAGAQLAVAPAAVTLRFNESVTFVADSIRLIDATGAPVAGVGVPVHSEGGASASAALPALPDGGYVVAWTIVSADGHPASGAFTFVVGSGMAPDASIVAGAAVGGGSASAGVLLKVLRGLGYLGLTMSIGIWAFVLLVDRQAAADRVLRALVASGGALVAVSSLARIPAQAAYTGLGWHTIVEQDVGTAWIALAGVGTVLALAPIDWERVGAERARRRARGAGSRRRGGRRLRRARCGRSRPLAGTRRDGGARGRRVRMGRRAHGARAALVRRVGERRWVVAARFSNIAMVAAAVVVASGIVQSIRQLETWSEVTGTDFGRTLIVKVALVLVLLVLAAASRRSVSRRGGRLGRTVVAEVAFTVLILGVTGFLAGASPVEAEQAAASEVTGGGTVEVEQGDRVASIGVTPGRAGSNEVDVSVFNRVDVGELPDELTVEIAPADGSVGAVDLAVEPVSQSRVIAPAAQFTFPGTWNVTVRARYGEFESVAFTTPVTITP